MGHGYTHAWYALDILDRSEDLLEWGLSFSGFDEAREDREDQDETDDTPSSSTHSASLLLRLDLS